MAAWWWYAIMALLLWGCWGVLNKVAAAHLSGRLIFCLELGAYLVVAAGVLFVERPTTLGPPISLAAALGAGFCGALGLLCFLEALTIGKAAVVVPFTALYPVITVLLSLVFLQEILTLRQMGGIAAATMAVWLLSS